MKRVLSACLAVLALLAGAVRPVHALAFQDSTTSDGWRLANGLEVRTRHVPGMAGVLVSMAFRAGSAYDPAGREGLAELLAELQFTSAAGTAPARSRAVLDSLRPLGWGSRVSPRLAVFTEAVDSDRLGAQLQEQAARLRGVTVTPGGLAAALAAVRRDAGERTFGRPELALYSRVRDVAAGIPDDVVVTRAAGRALEAVTPAEAGALLRGVFVPANASLAIVGDLAGADVRKLVDDAFAALPAGVARPEAQVPALAAGSRKAEWPGLPRSFGSVGIIAPPLDDTLHAAFFLSTVFVGGYMREYAGPVQAPLRSRFQYSIMEEPDLMRVYPNVAETETDPDAMVTNLANGFELLAEQMIAAEMVEAVRARVDWMLGGPIPYALRTPARQAPWVLEPVASGTAARALWKGDAFWDRYRRSFETTRLMPDNFYRWMRDPAHQARLLLVPRR